MLEMAPPRRPGRGPWRALLGQLAPLLVGMLLLTAVSLLIAAFEAGANTPDREEVPGQLRLGGQPAPDFRLRDQFDAPTTLAESRGKVVLLTFLYSNCPDLCPVTLGKLRLVRQQLGAQAAEVAVVVVTVDPERDDTARRRHYLEVQGLAQQVAFLSGERSALERVWRDYGIAVARGPATGADGAGGYEVVHTDRIYVIDRAGCVRGLLRSTASPQELLVTLAGPLGGRDTGAAVGCG